MTIEEQFNRIAKAYDSNRKKFIPCFEAFYKETTAFIAENIPYPKRILDLGAGTGLLTYFWYEQFPKAQYTLVDIAGDMLHVAKERFAGIDTMTYQIEDYIKSFPEDDYDCIISALSIHHLDFNQKKELFKKIYEKLPTNGIFVNYDQFCANHDELKTWFDTYWEKRLTQKDLSKEDIALWRERRLLDKECSVEEELNLLRDSGFKIVECLYLNQKFAILMAIK